MKRMMTRAGAAVIGGAMAIGMAGCLVSGSGSTSFSGPIVKSTTLDVIRDEHMTPDQVVEMLGMPTSTVETDTGVIYAYASEKVSRSSGAVFLLFSGSEKHTTRSVAYVKFENGRAARTWIEN